MGRLLAALALLAGTASATVAAAGEPVDVELVLLADATGSIDDAEIRLQREGYAAALGSTEVLAAISQGFERRIAVTFVEWADQSSQEVVVPWTVIDGPGSAAAFGQTLLSVPRRAFGRNAIGSALAFGRTLIEANDIEGHRKVIDLSGDSANSWNGIPLALARAEVLAAGITINGLAIACRDCNGRPAGYDLEAAFAERIVGGPASFVVTADDGGASFAEAVRRKLVLEIAGITPALGKALREEAEPTTTRLAETAAGSPRPAPTSVP